MTIYDDLLANGFPPEIIVSYTDMPGKPRQVTFNRSLTNEEMEIYFNLLDPERVTRNTDFISSKADMKAQYQTTITSLTMFIDNPSPTTAEVLAQVKLHARINRFVLRLLRYMIFG